jgi:hypothetical protein
VPQDDDAPQTPGSGGNNNSGGTPTGGDAPNGTGDSGDGVPGSTGEDSTPTDNPTSDAGGAVSSDPVVTGPAGAETPEAADVAEDGGSNILLIGLAGAAAMLLIGLALVALGRRKSEADA